MGDMRDKWYVLQFYQNKKYYSYNFQVGKNITSDQLLKSFIPKLKLVSFTFLIIYFQIDS